MLRRILLCFFIFFLFLISILTILPYSPEKISNFIYRELTYNKIANYYKGNSHKETIENLFNYVTVEQAQHSDKYLIEDMNSFNDIIRGVGACDQQAFTLMTLLEKLNISKTRLRDVQAHTYSEVFLDGKWVIVDPFFSFFPQNTNDEYLSLNDLVNLEISTKNLKNLNSLDAEFRKNIKDIYLYNDIRWDDGAGPEFIDYRAYDLNRIILSNFSNYIYFLFGDLYLYWFQNIHLNSSQVSSMTDKGKIWIPNYIHNYDNNDEAFQLFYKARSYDILERDSLAYEYYSKVMESHPNSYWAVESKYHFSKLKSV